jgi:hypothetical protein
MKRKNRIVLKLEKFTYTSLKGEKWESDRFVEVYTSSWRVDCINWINRQLDKDTTIYRIYKED